MDFPTSAEGRRYSSDVFEALANRRRRSSLHILQRISGASLEELATHLVASEADKPLTEVSRSEVQNALLDLTHVHVPRLTDANLLAQVDGVVTTTGHPALRDPMILAMIETEAPAFDDVLACLADEYRRIALTTLHRVEGPVDRGELAAEIAETVQCEGDTAKTPEDVLDDLYHVHLPKLERAGLVEYGADEVRASFEDDSPVTALCEALDARLDHPDARGDDDCSPIPL